MRKKVDRGPRQSQLAAGWTVEADASTASGTGTTGAANDGGSGVLAAASAEALAASETADAVHDEAATAQLSNSALVLLGVGGGLYLLYTWVWFSWSNYYSQVNAAVAEGSGLIGAVLQQTLFWAAPAAPLLWFVSTLVLCRGARTWKLALWLFIGAVVLLPLPALITVGGA